MLLRFLSILKSLATNEKIEEPQMSTTIDDTKEGTRITFDKERVRQLLIKCDLLEHSEL